MYKLTHGVVRNPNGGVEQAEGKVRKLHCLVTDWGVGGLAGTVTRRSGSTVRPLAVLSERVEEKGRGGGRGRGGDTKRGRGEEEGRGERRAGSGGRGTV